MDQVVNSARNAHTVSRQVRLIVAALVATLVFAAAVGQCLLQFRMRAAADQTRLIDWADWAAAVVRGAPVGAHPDGAAALVKRLRVGEPSEFTRVRELAQALIGDGRLDGFALTDEVGDVLFYWPNAAGAPRTISPPRSGELAAVSAESDQTGMSPLQMACASIGDSPIAWTAGYACVLRARTAASAFSVAPHPVFVAWLAGIGLVGFFIVSRKLHRRVIEPIERITGIAGEACAGLAERDDEFGEIARRLNELSEELQAARDDAQRLKKSIDVAVNRETKQISVQLRRAERAAELDPLTGLANRRFINERLEAVFSEQRSRGVNLVIIMLDVDNFKTLNDRAGHAAGDALLHFIGTLLRGSLREGDVGVRYGGDEFALVLVDVTGAQARLIAERIVRLFAQQAVTAKLPAPVTLSAGVASLDEVEAGSGAELLARADDTLFRSKRGGKNMALSAAD